MDFVPYLIPLLEVIHEFNFWVRFFNEIDLDGTVICRLDGGVLLNLLRGKRLVFVGDSLNRNMWESLVCILRNSVKDLTRVYEANGRHHFRGEASYSFIFKVG